LLRGRAGSLLVDEPIAATRIEHVDAWKMRTLDAWAKLARHFDYAGPYHRAVLDSVRALRLLTYEPSGAVLAAATTSLPAVLGGSRNWDYRFAWLRDAGMITSALTRAGSDGEEELRFLELVCRSEAAPPALVPPPLSCIDGARPQLERELPLGGYRGSRPVRLGNDAAAQLQLDAFGNVLVAAKVLYGKLDTREHWKVVARIADFVAESWSRPDNGVWEERTPRQYTAGKVIAARSLEFVADMATTPEEARRWRAAAADIRTFVAKECVTRDGAYAAFAGSDVVDVSAALFPVWDFCDPFSPEMNATLVALDRDAYEGGLYRRVLLERGGHEELGFVAGSLWVAQYLIMRGELERATRIIDKVLEHATDLGQLAEGAGRAPGEMLGNFPQAFAHAAMVGVAVDLRDAITRPAAPGSRIVVTSARDVR